MPVSSDCADWDANPPYNGCVPVVARGRNRAFHIGITFGRRSQTIEEYGTTPAIPWFFTNRSGARA